MQNNGSSWIEISASALRRNVKQFRNLLKQTTKLMAVVKGNAYGHGLIETSKIFVDQGIDWLGVFDFTEALTLRGEGIRVPVLVMGPILAKDYNQAKKENISVVISRFDQLGSLISGLKVHIKIDTGLSRQGFNVDDLEHVLDKIPSDVNIEGVMTHLADAQNLTDTLRSDMQLKKFDGALDIFESGGRKVKLKHAVASDGFVTVPVGEYDMVRAGILLYGISPDCSWQDKLYELNLLPVLSWKTRVTELKEIDSGSSVGYGKGERVARKTKIAILPVGYYEGYDRSFSQKAKVIIQGRKCEILGNICMNMTMVDCTDVLDVKVGDECVLIGRMGNEEISVVDLAQIANTISYEIVSRINSQISRMTIE